MTCLVAFDSQRLRPNIIVPTLARISHIKFIENFQQRSRLSQHFVAFEGILSKDLGIERFFLSKDTNVFCKPLLGPAIAFHHRPMMADTGASLQSVQGPVSQNSRNFLGQTFFQVPQFSLYLRDAEVLCHQPSPSFAYKTTTTQFTSNGDHLR